MIGRRDHTRDGSNRDAHPVILCVVGVNIHLFCVENVSVEFVGRVTIEAVLVVVCALIGVEKCSLRDIIISKQDFIYSIILLQSIQ